MHFNLTRPCANCPFNKTGAIDLHPERVPGIQADLLADDWQSFTCHKTVSGETIEDEYGDEFYRAGPKDQHCAGAMIWLLKRGHPSVPMRLATLTEYNLDYDALLAQADKIID